MPIVWFWTLSLWSFHRFIKVLILNCCFSYPSMLTCLQLLFHPVIFPWWWDIIYFELIFRPHINASFNTTTKYFKMTIIWFRSRFFQSSLVFTNKRFLHSRNGRSLSIRSKLVCFINVIFSWRRYIISFELVFGSHGYTTSSITSKIFKMTIIWFWTLFLWFSHRFINVLILNGCLPNSSMCTCFQLLFHPIISS